MKKTVLFDLDGTLTDPFEGITKSIVYSLKRLGVTAPPCEELRDFIGPPLFESYSRRFGFSDDLAVKAVAFYREYYSEKGIYECAVYDGLLPALDRLVQNGYELAVATSKPEHFAIKVLEHFELRGYFAFVAGASLDKSRVEKSAVIAYALKSVARPVRAVMVGDRKHDIIGAAQNGLNSVGVLYGYGDRDELLSAGANAIAETPLDIPNAVDKLFSRCG